MPTEFGQDAVEIPGGRVLWADLDGAGAPWAVLCPQASISRLHDLDELTRA